MDSRVRGSGFELDDALLKARVKMRLVGNAGKSVKLGRFTLLRRCGSGGEGVVYEAHDPLSGGKVALKRLSGLYAFGGASLRGEFRSLAGIVHPNLLVLHELFCVDQHWFLTMELLSGKDFLTQLREGASGAGLDLVQLRAALAQLLAGVSAIHAAGKIHRDLKPSNVFIEPDGRVVIIDYGLVTEQRSLVGTGPSERRLGAGTPSYMAPEQAAGSPVTKAADLYAVGVMLFEAMTGLLPGRALQPQDAQRARACLAHMPSDLVALCMALRETDSASRPTAEQALALLDAQPARVRRGLSQRAPAVRECFVGRSEELGVLHDALAQALEEQSVAVLLHGASGIGKSTLLQRFAAELAADGDMLVLKGRCFERENTPYKVFEPLVEGLVRHLNELPDEVASGLLPREVALLARAFPAFAQLRVRLPQHDEDACADEPAERKARAFAALFELLRRVRARCPVVLCVDDLQWGDLDSVYLLEQLLGGPDAPRLLFVGTYRREERATSPFLRVALAEGALAALGLRVCELPLDELAREQAEELLQATLRDRCRVNEEQLRACVSAASGIPYLLVELAEQLSSEPLARSVEVDLSALLRRRVAGCSPAAQRVLELLCCAGRPLQLALALRAAHDQGVPFEAAAELSAARLARFRDGDRERYLELYHDLIRQRLAPDVTSERSRTLHAAIAETMEELGIDQPTLLVEHLLLAGAQSRAAQTAERAAERAAGKFAWNRAAELFALAAEASDAGLGQRVHVRARRAEMLGFAARHDAAGAAYLEASELVCGPARQELLCLAAQQYLRAGKRAESLPLVRESLSAVGYDYPEHDAAAAGHYLAGQLQKRLVDRMTPRVVATTRSPESHARLETLDAIYRDLWFFDPVRGGLVHVWFYREARRCRDRHYLRALVWEVFLEALLHGPRVRARLGELLQQITVITAALGTPYDAALSQLAEAVYLVHCCFRPRDALSPLRAAEHLLSHCPGTDFERGWLALALDYALEITGNLSELADAALLRQQKSRDRDDGYTAHQLLVSVPLALLIRDRPDAALSFIEQKWQRGARSVFTDYAAIIRRSTALLYRGEVVAAHATLIEESKLLKTSRVLRSLVAEQHDSYHRARNAAALYWHTRSPSAKREVQQRAAQAKGLSVLARGFFHLLEASVARADGQIADARASLRSGLESFRAMQCDHGEWAVRYRLAELEGSSEQLEKARGILLARGVHNPERWVSLTMPGAGGWD